MMESDTCWPVKLTQQLVTLLFSVKQTCHVQMRVHQPTSFINLLKPTGHVMRQQFNIQQLYVLPTLYLSENKQRLVSLTA